MGINPSPDKCFLTGLPTVNIPSSVDSIDYSIFVNGNRQAFSFSPSINWESDDLKKARHIFQAMVLNGEWPVESDTPVTRELLSNIISFVEYPITSQDKRNYFLESVYKNGGNGYGIVSIEWKQFYRAYATDSTEMESIIRGLELEGYIEITNKENNGIKLVLTPKAFKEVQGNVEKHMEKRYSFPPGTAPSIFFVYLAKDKEKLKPLRDLFAHNGFSIHDHGEGLGDDVYLSGAKSTLQNANYTVLLKSYLSDVNNQFGSMAEAAMLKSESCKSNKSTCVYVAKIDDSRYDSRPGFQDLPFFDVRIKNSHHILLRRIVADWAKQIDNVLVQRNGVSKIQTAQDLLVWIINEYYATKENPVVINKLLLSVQIESWSSVEGWLNELSEGGSIEYERYQRLEDFYFVITLTVQLLNSIKQSSASQGENDSSEDVGDPIILGLTATDGTDWFEDTRNEITRNRYSIVWWNKLPSGSPDTLDDLRKTLNTNGFFDFYYFKGGTAHYKARILDFAIEQEYDFYAWEQKYLGLELEETFGSYVDDGFDVNKNARIVFVTDSLEPLSNGPQLSDFVFAYGYKAPTHNNLQPFVEIKGIANNTSESTKQNNERPRIILNEAAPEFSITDEIPDAIGVNELSKVLATLIANLRSTDENMFGVFGRWGRGKTKLWKRTWEQLEKSEQHKFQEVKFHAWRYQDTPASWAYLYELIAKKYVTHKGDNRWNRIEQVFKLNLKRKGWWPIILFAVTISTGFVSYAFSDQIQKIILWISGVIGTGTLLIGIKLYSENRASAMKLFREYISRPTFKDLLGIQAEIQKELTVLLKLWFPDQKPKKNKPEQSASPTVLDNRLVIFVDDIDRCSEDRIIQIIDSFKVMLEDVEIAKRIVVVVAIDERVLKMSIVNKYHDLVGKMANTGGDIENSRALLTDIAKEYIDKLFIAGIRLNKLTKFERREIFDAITKDKVERREKERTDYSPTQPINSPHIDQTKKDDDESADRFLKSSPITSTVINASELFHIDEIEANILKKCLENARETTPRAIRIFYYRYLLAKQLLKIRFISNPMLKGHWNNLEMKKEILPLLLIGQSEGIYPREIESSEAIKTIELFSTSFVLNTELFGLLEEIAEMVVPY